MSLPAGAVVKVVVIIRDADILKITTLINLTRKNSKNIVSVAVAATGLSVTEQTTPVA